MTKLTIYADGPSPQPTEVTDDPGRIHAALQGIGVGFERWQAAAELPQPATQEQVLGAYRADVDRLMQREGFAAVDVISMHPEHPERTALRHKFLEEHTHSEPEVRFFVAGGGLFYLHAAGAVYAVHCQRDDLLSIPAGTTHWFDMGPAPSFTAIRLFTNPAGWVANFTGDPIAQRYPRLDAGA